MVVTTIVLSTMLAARTADVMRGLFLCLALALIVNLVFVLHQSPQVASYGSALVKIGYQGYFAAKNQLGECAAAAFLLSMHEVFQRGWGRRTFGAIAVAIAIFLVLKSDSKTAFGLTLVCPLLAWLTLLTRKATGVSVAVILTALPIGYMLLSSVSDSSVLQRMSFILYHDSSLTGRTTIWEFAKTEIAQSPLVGWGYQSFWLVPDSPSLTAPGWVKSMPNAHNGYYDTMLETGYAGFAFLLLFIMATLHAVGRVADRDPARARLLLSFVLFMILYNFFESLWMRGFEFLWVIFVIVAAEIGRYRPPFPLSRAAHGLKRGRLGGGGESLDAPSAQSQVGLSWRSSP
jgi:exopolysaccharide production protein ExoQ